MSKLRRLEVLDGVVGVADTHAVLHLTNWKAQLSAHCLEPKPDPNGDKAEIGKYQIVARRGAGTPRVLFRKGETFGLEGELPKSEWPRLRILEGPPWPKAAGVRPELPEEEAPESPPADDGDAGGESDPPADPAGEDSAGEGVAPPPGDDAGGGDRAEQIRLAFGQLEEGNREHYTASGEPRVDVLEDLTGLELSRAEISEALASGAASGEG